MNQVPFVQLEVGFCVRITAANTEYYGKIGTITYLSKYDENGHRGAAIVFSEKDNPEYPQQAYWFREHEWMAL